MGNRARRIRAILATTEVVLKTAVAGKEARMVGELRAAVEQARREQSLFFAALLPEESITAAFTAASAAWCGHVFTPVVIVWVFLSQCLSADHSCRDAVGRLISWLLARGQKACAAETGGYCTARDKLPEAVGEHLLRHTGRQPERTAPPEWLWHKRRVVVADGTTVTMPDTKANQKEYPQLTSQKPGCGFPILRMVVVFSLAVGTVIEMAMGKYEGKRTGENSLLRTLQDQLESGDVLLLDRYFSGWFDLASWKKRGVDSVVRKHQLRATDFRAGRRLGHDDHVVAWRKPKRPTWMTQDEYDALPETLTLRELRIQVTQPGFRTRVILVVTTLLDATEFSADEIAQLYRRRWQAELNLRSLKIVLQMDQLRCLTPHRVRNEIRMHLTAYNLIRGVMAAAAQAAGRQPWTVSFKGALQALNNMLPLLLVMTPEAWCHQLLQMIAASEVGNRPDRYEPRVKKRRPKKYKLLREPRQNYRNRIAARR
jgi:hypothetical protein